MSNEFSSNQKGQFTKRFNEFKQTASNHLIEIKGALNTVKSYETQLLTDRDDEPSIKTKISDLHSDIESLKSSAIEKEKEIEDLHTKLLVTDDENKSLSDEIKDAAVIVENNRKQTSRVRALLETANKKINGYSEESEEGEDGNYVPGLLEELKTLISNSKKFHGEQTSKSEVMYKNINKLLAGATSTSLAGSYEDQRKKYIGPNIFWTVLFIIAMVVMVVIGIITVKEFTALDEAIKAVIARSPVFAALIWLGMFSSKQQSQNKRLEQEYAHKAALAKSYEGYKQEVSDLSEETETSEILSDLLKNLIETIKNNPSETLDKNYHNNGYPLYNSTELENNSN